MNPASAIPLRYVVAPAVAQLYEDDKEGFDAVTDEPVMAKLSNENDMVTGQESVYGYILNKHATTHVSLDSVDGSEGFFKSVKKGFTDLIKAVKDFFKWIWSFFGSKKKGIENRAEDIAKAIDKNGAKEGEIPYPKSVVGIYQKTGKLDNNIAWLSKSVDNTAKAIDKTIYYVDLVKGLVVITGEKLFKEGGEKEFLEVYDNFNKALAEKFGIKGKATNFLGTNDLVLNAGRFAMEFNPQAAAQAKDAKFHTTTAQLQTYIKDYDALMGKIDAMTTAIHSIEGGIVHALENKLIVAGALNKQNPTQKKAVEDLKKVVRATMGNIKVLQGSIYRAANAILDIIAAATK